MKHFEFKQLKEPNTPHRIAKWCNGKICFGGAGEYVHIEIVGDKGIEHAHYEDYIVKIDGSLHVYKYRDFNEKFKGVEKGGINNGN